ncbi:MAG: LysR family transcriptional regulator [Rhodocyclaceae bacterium]
MPATDLPLNDLEAFAAVARHRSFRRAATERGVSASLLSQTVRRLEDRLGVQLLHRTTRSVSPTEAGELLLAGVEPALSGIAATVERINGLRTRPSGRLRINAPTPAVHLALAPMLAGFLSRYPDVHIEVVADSAFVDIVGQGFDAGIRFGEDLAQDMVAVPLHSPRQRIVIASPAYLAQAGTPASPHQLLAHKRVAHRFPGGSIYEWEFSRGAQALRIAPQGPLTVNDPIVALQAALDGIGLVWTFEEYARPHIAAGALVEVLAEWRAPPLAPFLYFSSRRHMPAPLRAFIDYVRETAA